MLKTSVTLLSLCLLLVAGGAHAANMYKYKDDKGNEIVGSQVPAEYVKNGYKVLNERGQVIREVPRTLTEAERAAKSEELARQQQQEAARKKQEEEDRLLLRLYRTPEEVIRRRDSTVEELDAQLMALNALLVDAQARVDTLQKRADDNVAAGRDVPASVAGQLEDATEERNRLQRQIARIEAERAQTFETAQKNIDRLKELLHLE